VLWQFRIADCGFEKTKSMEHGAWSKKSEVRSQTTDYRWFKALNVEPQNKEPQKCVMIT